MQRVQIRLIVAAVEGRPFRRHIRRVRCEARREGIGGRGRRIVARGWSALEALLSRSGNGFVEGAAARVAFLLKPVRYRRKLAFADAVCSSFAIWVMGRLGRDFLVDLDLEIARAQLSDRRDEEDIRT